MMCGRSRLRLDQVSSDAVPDKTGIPEIRAFMNHMRMIGEPFCRLYGLRVPKPLSAQQIQPSLRRLIFQTGP
jgi:hypothetical protein